MFVIMGTNVGTCMTSILSSIGTNANAKRAAFIHFMFNFIGSAVFIVICLCWADFNAVVIDSWIPNPQQQIAMFHTCSTSLLRRCLYLFRVACQAFSVCHTRKEES
ncbi:MAG: hypothetical protein ACLU1U_06705 [Lachnospiraceae bacterium]